MLDPLCGLLSPYSAFQDLITDFRIRLRLKTLDICPDLAK